MDLLVEFFRHNAMRAGQDRKVQVTGDDPPGTWWLLASLFLLQAINHSTEHRSQVATILTQLGSSPLRWTVGPTSSTAATWWTSSLHGASRLVQTASGELVVDQSDVAFT